MGKEKEQEQSMELENTDEKISMSIFNSLS